MHLFMQLSSTLCSLFLTRLLTAFFVCLLCRTFQPKCKSRMLALWQLHSSFEGNFKELGENQVRHRPTIKKTRNMIPARKPLFFVNVSYPLCRSCIRQEPLLHFAQKGKRNAALTATLVVVVVVVVGNLAKRCRRCGERTGVRASRDVSKQRPSKKPIFPF